MLINFTRYLTLTNEFYNIANRIKQKKMYEKGFGFKFD